ncbi:MAG TPA: hypothetical protein DCR97_01450 [Deltaproteobacteria bacterium]|nr:hypothetical protein [Deltaproteobacteria bacterium]
MVNSFRGNAPFSLMDEAKNAAGLESLEGPGDGRFDFRDHVSVRVSTCRTINGEKAVLRLVDKGLSSAGLDALGMPADTNERLKKALKQPGGLFLCTGPVGSGKTTTLYSLINYVNAVDKAIITVEYPIEYALDHVAQLRVDSADGLALSEGIRSALRQDPDVCAVGEIREHESAILVVQAALAGVTALTTFCWNDTIGALARLSEIGLEPSLLASSVTCVMGQRLVRKICEGCRETYAPPPPVLESIDVHDTVPLYRGVGCPACRHTGYRGRTAVFEFLFMDDQLRTLIAAGAPRADIERAAQAGGMKTLRENGIAKALLGITTLEEALNRTKTTAQIVK